VGRLAGFFYREVTRRLRSFGFQLIARGPAATRFGVTLGAVGRSRSLIIQATGQRGHSGRSSAKQESRRFQLRSLTLRRKTTRCPRCDGLVGIGVPLPLDGEFSAFSIPKSLSMPDASCGSHAMILPRGAPSHWLHSQAKTHAQNSSRREAPPPLSIEEL
jgi:hypothetical protein